jgi:hypothetical protein
MTADPLLDEFRSLVSVSMPDAKSAKRAKSTGVVVETPTFGPIGTFGKRHAQINPPSKERPPNPSTTSGYDEESGLLIDWIEGYRRLAAMRRPRAIPAATWTWLTAAAGELLSRWGVQLAAQGWSTAEVYGVAYEVPMPRISDGGLLAHLVEHRKLEAIGPRSAVLRLPDGSSLRLVRPLATAPGVVLAWELTTGQPPRESSDE